MIQSIYYMTLKKKEDQSMDVSILHRRGNKIIIRGKGQGGENVEGRREHDQVWEGIREKCRG